jgi:hypothetical protein
MMSPGEFGFAANHQQESDDEFGIVASKLPPDSKLTRWEERVGDKRKRHIMQTKPRPPVSLWLRRQQGQLGKLLDHEQRLRRDQVQLMKDLLALQRPGAQGERKRKEDQLNCAMQMLRHVEQPKRRLNEKIKRLSVIFRLDIDKLENSEKLSPSDTIPKSGSGNHNHNSFAPTSPRIQLAAHRQSMQHVWTEMLWTDEILEKAMRRAQPSLDEKCSICLEYLVTNSAVSELRCGHHYHTDCLFQLITRQSSSTSRAIGQISCPMCRTSLVSTGTSLGASASEVGSRAVPTSPLYNPRARPTLARPGSTPVPRSHSPDRLESPLSSTIHLHMLTDSDSDLTAENHQGARGGEWWRG